MKKFLFLLCSLLATVGVKAADVTVTYGPNNGTFYRGGAAYTGSGSAWTSVWESTAEPKVSFSVGVNNINASTGGIASGQSGSSVYTISVPGGYIIKSYSFMASEGTNSDVKLTPEGKDAITLSQWEEVVNITDINAVSTTFTLVGANKEVTLADFTITVAEDPSYVPPVYVTALSNLSNNKAYVITNARATWNIADAAEEMTTVSKWNRDAKSQQFAIINHDGNYYLYSVNAGKYLYPDPDENSKKGLLGDPQAVTITETGDANYPFFFKFSDTKNVNINGSGLVCIDGWTTVDAGNANAIIEAANFDPTEALKAFGGSEEPIYIETDLTSQFKSLTNKDNWTCGNGNKAGTAGAWACPFVTPNGFTSSIAVCEFYETNCDRTGDILYQTVTGLAPGIYQIELYGGAAYTFGRGFSSEAFSQGEWQENQSITENTGVFLFAQTSEGKYDKEIPMYYATTFPEGAAVVSLNNVVIGSNGEVKIGMSKTSKSTNWHVIQLKGVTAKVLATDALAAAVAQAEDISEASVPAKVYSELQITVDQNNKAWTTAEEYEAAIKAIEDAVMKAGKYAAAKAYFDKMGAVLEKTNVYTEEAYNAVYGTWLADYEAGTLDEATMATLTADLAYSTGWHSTNNIDNVLLSSWTIGGEQASEYDKSLYINTWSVEGNNDDSNFFTPFFEYWTGDDQSLGATALTATVTGLEAGATYDVTVFARERAKNGTAAADVTGITLKVGDGEAVDVTEGTVAVAKEGGAATQFNFGNYTASGKADADGKLTITFDVAADNNISWLSYRDVKYVKAGDTPELPTDRYG